MTIKECIDIVDNIKPNQYTVREKVMWLSFLDKVIIDDVLKTHEGYDGRYDSFEGYTEDKLSVTLIVPSPYDEVYTAYLKMKIDGENGETAKYNNSMVLYNTYMLKYRKYYNKTHMPLGNGKSELSKVSVNQVGLSDAEYENLKKDLTFILTEYFGDAVSEDKLYGIVTSYVQNNSEMLKGKDGYTPIKGVDYWTDDDKAEFFGYADEILKNAKTYTDKALADAKAYADGEKVFNINELEYGSYTYDLPKNYGVKSVDVQCNDVIEGAENGVICLVDANEEIIGEVEFIMKPSKVITVNLEEYNDVPIAKIQFLLDVNDSAIKSVTYYYNSDKAYTDEKIGDIDAALDELHAYAEMLKNGGA